MIKVNQQLRAAEITGITVQLRCIKPRYVALTSAKRFLHGLMLVTGSPRLNCYYKYEEFMQFH